MNRLSIILPLFSVFLFVFSAKIVGQTEKELLAELTTEDEEAIKALVLYPEDTRLNILEATRHPEALIKIESIQTQTSTAFRELLESYPQSTQEMIWDLTRYPGLIDQLVATGGDSEARVKKVLKDFPDIIHERAENAVRYNYHELAEINTLNRNAESAFGSLLNEYPPRAQAAFQALIELPEVLEILTENIRFTVLVGDLYEKEPDWVIRQADSLALEVARENAQELEDWKTSLADNPEAMDELRSSAEEFAEEYGYDDDYYDYEDDDLYYDDDEVHVVHHYYYDYHYPYWFGYPYWYYYPRWRVYPYWYDWGFYLGPGRTMVVIGMPSFYFTHWYFYHPYHHYHYPHLSTHFVNHYYGHRSSASSVRSGVNDWRSRNREVITDDWLRDDGRLTSRFEEYGKFEADRAKYNRAHPDKTKSQAEYAERYAKRYPSLSKAAKERKSDGREISAEPRKNTEPKSQPRIDTEPRTRKTEPKVQPKTRTEPRTKVEPKTQPRTRTQPQPKVQPETRTTVPRVKKGTDLHRDTWERSAPKAKPRISQPKPRTTTPKTRKPSTRSKGTTKKRGG